MKGEDDGDDAMMILMLVMIMMAMIMLTILIQLIMMRIIFNLVTIMVVFTSYLPLTPRILGALLGRAVQGKRF